MRRRGGSFICIVIIAVCVLFTYFFFTNNNTDSAVSDSVFNTIKSHYKEEAVSPVLDTDNSSAETSPKIVINGVEIPEWDGITPYVYIDETGAWKPEVWDASDFASKDEVNLDAEDINQGTPFFTEEDVERGRNEVWEEYSPLDELGRCGPAYINACRELMPTEPRGDISSVTPSGWNQAYYPDLITDGGALWNRAHLASFAIAGENDNPLNLISGTRWFNLRMTTHENFVNRYIRYTNNHVLYRVTPVFYGDDLVAMGVLMEGYSVEDDGEGVCFCLFVYNEQPGGICIDHSDGSSRVLEDTDN